MVWLAPYLADNWLYWVWLPVGRETACRRMLSPAVGVELCELWRANA